MNDAAASALLPAGLIDVLPPRAAFEAAVVERMMSVFAGFGYERIKPPLIEFEETLFAGSGAALTGETFRLMDPISQRMLALRPDMTMQVARIAATRLAFRPRPLRLSYAGQVVRVRGSQTRPERQLGQVGAELIGASAAAADVEVIVMAAAALAQVGVGELSVDLGLPTLVPCLIANQQHLEPAIAGRLRLALDRKDVTAVMAMAPLIGHPLAQLLSQLVSASGPADNAMPVLAALPLPPAAEQHRAALSAVCEGLHAAAPDLSVTIDPVETRGFEYHTGVTFSLFAPATAGELGRGGHYRTEAGEPATGVTLLLDAVLTTLPSPPPAARLMLPVGVAETVAQQFRAEGWIAIAALVPFVDPLGEARRLGCSHVLIDGEVRSIVDPD